MSFELNKHNINEICEVLIQYLSEGNTIECFLADFQFSRRKWKKLLSKNKKLQNALEDGNTFYKAHWQKRLASEMNNRKGNSVLAKMAFENSLGLTDLALKKEEEQIPAKRYKVYLDLRPEKEGEENDNMGKNVDRLQQLKEIGINNQLIREFISKDKTQPAIDEIYTEKGKLQEQYNFLHKLSSELENEIENIMLINYCIEFFPMTDENKNILTDIKRYIDLYGGSETVENYISQFIGKGKIGWEELRIIMEVCPELIKNVIHVKNICLMNGFITWNEFCKSLNEGIINAN